MEMILKILVILLLVSIFYALGSALYYLVKEGGQSPKIVKALMWRLGLSLLLFVLILITFLLHWVVSNPQI